eukprot:108305-Prymnesium_polylepis.1
MGARTRKIRRFIDTTGTQDGRRPIGTCRTISPDQCEKILLERLGNRAKDLCIQVDRLTLLGTAVTSEGTVGAPSGQAGAYPLAAV